MDKTRDKANSVDKMELMGNVKGCDVWVFDDMGDTLGTVCKAAKKLKEEGAKSVRAVFTHGILSGNAYKNLDETPELEMVYISDTCPPKPAHDKIKVVSCVPVLEQAMLKIINEESLSEFNK
jgi:ribose-phosphate pyrophosphokinase